MSVTIPQWAGDVLSRSGTAALATSKGYKATITALFFVRRDGRERMTQWYDDGDERRAQALRLAMSDGCASEEDVRAVLDLP